MAPKCPIRRKQKEKPEPRMSIWTLIQVFIFMHDNTGQH